MAIDTSLLLFVLQTGDRWRSATGIRIGVSYGATTTADNSC